MFSKVALFVVSAFTLAAVAAPGGPASTSNQCNVGKIQCCNQVQAADHEGVQFLAGLLNIAAGALTGQVGVNCSPLSVIGIGGNSCNASPVCCSNNNFNGLIALGCTPINLNL